MSQQHGFSRRQTLSLLGAAAGTTVATALVARSGEPLAQNQFGTTTSARLQHIFGYGSLIQRASRTGTWSTASIASPVIVKGIARGWFDQTDVPSWSPTYLGAEDDASADCNGVLFPVYVVELESFVRREAGYRLTRLDPTQITMLDGSSAPPDDEIWYFATTQKRFVSKDHPIVQSYVDVCLDGCLELEAVFPQAKQSNFAERFMRTTRNWGLPWINDRIYPWRPFVHVPRAAAIDALIQKVLGREMFDQITLR